MQHLEKKTRTSTDVAQQAGSLFSENGYYREYTTILDKPF
jgi:hypothetical protein